MTQEAKVLVKESSKNLLKQLRDGDWKEKATNTFNSDGSLTEGSNNNDEDLRIEGTTAYLPPEVVIGGYPTTAADVWALGCVLFQCISGRPPILEETDELTAQRIVTFDLSAEEHNFFGEYNASTFRDNAKALIQKMLDRDGARRPCILEISEDNFFDGKDIFSLHRRPAHPLDVGSIAPKSDAKWSRRQFRYAFETALVSFKTIFWFMLLQNQNACNNICSPCLHSSQYHLGSTATSLQYWICIAPHIKR